MIKGIVVKFCVADQIRDHFIVGCIWKGEKEGDIFIAINPAGRQLILLSKASTLVAHGIHHLDLLIEGNLCPLAGGNSRIVINCNKRFTTTFNLSGSNL